MMRTAAWALLGAIGLLCVGGTGAWAQQRAADFSHCLRTDDGRPVCFHRETGRLTIVSEAIFQAVVGGAARPPAPRSAEPVGSAQATTPPSPAQTPAAATYTGVPVLRANGSEQGCRAVTAWVDVFLREHPNPNPSRDAPINLLRDAYFVPFFGASFQTLTAQQQNRIDTIILGRCGFSGQHTSFYISAVRQLEAAQRATLLAQLQPLNAASEWRNQALVSMAQAPTTREGLDTLDQLQRTGAQRMASLWPSERRSFEEQLQVRRRALVEAAVRNPPGVATGAPISMAVLREWQAMLGPAREASSILTARIAAELPRALDAAFAEPASFPPTEEGRTQLVAWQRQLEADVAPFSGQPAVASVRQRFTETQLGFDRRFHLAMLAADAQASLERLERIAPLRTSQDQDVAARAREVFARDLAALVQARSAPMLGAPESQAGLEAFTAQRAAFERDFGRYRSEDSVRSASAALDQRGAQLLRAANIAFVRESGQLSMARAERLRGMARASGDAELSSLARGALEREVPILMDQRRAEIANLPASRDGLARLDSWLGAVRTDFAGYTEVASVEQTLAAVGRERTSLLQRIETSEIEQAAQAAPSVGAVDALIALARSQNPETAAQARSAAEAMLLRVLEQELARAPAVEAGLEGTSTLAAWASRTRQMFDRYNGFQAQGQAREQLAARVRAQRDRSLEPFAQALESARGAEIFAQTKRVIDQLPRDVVPDLAVEFDRIHANAFRLWAEGGSARVVSQPHVSSPPNDPLAGLLGGAGAGAARPSGAPSIPPSTSGTASADPLAALRGSSGGNPQRAPSPMPVNPVQPQAAPVPPSPHGEALARAISAAPTPMSAESMVFFGGVASDLIARCQVMSSHPNRADLARIARAAENQLMGTGYSNPNVVQTFQGNMATMGVFAAGVQFARLMECGPGPAEALAEQIAMAARRQTQGADGGVSNFVRTCTPRFSQHQCVCLANIGQAIYPNIHQMSYDRNIIANIIQSSPFVGGQVIGCGIIHY